MEVAGLAEADLEAVWMEGARAELEGKVDWVAQVVRSRRKRKRRRKRNMSDRMLRFRLD